MEDERREFEEKQVHTVEEVHVEFVSSGSFLPGYQLIRRTPGTRSK